jgi:hypothetical protein
MPDDITYTDALCGEMMSSSDDHLVLVVKRRDSDAQQEFYVHRGCLVRALRPGTPLGEVFDF